MKKFAVFDIDGTLHSSALGTDLLLQLSRDRVIPVDIEDHYKTWHASKPHLRANYFKEHLAPLFKEHLPGTSRASLQKAGKQLASVACSNIPPLMMREIDNWHSKGYFLMAISNSPFIAVEPLAKQLGFAAWQAPDFEFDTDNNYLHPKPGRERNKGILLKQLVKQHGLSWQDSAAYGDSIDDLPMLELVALPTAVNPTSELAQESYKA